MYLGRFWSINNFPFCPIMFFWLLMNSKSFYCFVPVIEALMSEIYWSWKVFVTFQSKLNAFDTIEAEHFIFFLIVVQPWKFRKPFVLKITIGASNDSFLERKTAVRLIRFIPNACQFLIFFHQRSLFWFGFRSFFWWKKFWFFLFSFWSWTLTRSRTGWTEEITNFFSLLLIHFLD